MSVEMQHISRAVTAAKEGRPETFVTKSTLYSAFGNFRTAQQYADSQEVRLVRVPLGYRFVKPS